MENRRGYHPLDTRDLLGKVMECKNFPCNKILPNTVNFGRKFLKSPSHANLLHFSI